MIKPGVRLCDIDKCARDIIAEVVIRLNLTIV